MLQPFQLTEQGNIQDSANTFLSWRTNSLAILLAQDIAKAAYSVLQHQIKGNASSYGMGCCQSQEYRTPNVYFK
jgi:hypothetical protein